MVRPALINLGEGLAARTAPGPGDGVLWIHGYTLDSRCWSELWGRLPDWSHLGVDLPGHGASLPLERGEELTVLARRIGARALARGVRHVVGLSFGSIVAMQIAAEHPREFRSLALASPLLGGGPFDRDIWVRYDAAHAAFQALGHGPHLRDTWMLPDAVLFRSLNARPAVRERLRRHVGQYPWWDLANDAYRRLWHHPHTLVELSRIDLPTLLVVGGADVQAVQQSARALDGTLPRCERVDVDDLGHHCVLEDPAAAAALLARHWRRNAGAETAEERRGADAGGH